MPSQADDDRYFDLKGLSAYSGLSVRTLQRHMANPERPLPIFQVRGIGKARGRVLVAKREFDAWMQAFRVDSVSFPDEDIQDAIRLLRAK